MAAIHRRSVVVRGLAAASAAVEAAKHGCYTQAAYGDVVPHSLLLHRSTANSYAGCASLLNRGLYLKSRADILKHPWYRALNLTLPLPLTCKEAIAWLGGSGKAFTFNFNAL